MKLFLSLALFAAFLLCPTACADGVREGLSLAAVQALPALFPFFVVSGLLVRCDTARLSPLLAKPLARLYGLPPEAAPALVLGLIGGYPVGATTACALLSEGVLSREAAERVNRFCNCASPGFCIGLVGLGVFGSAQAGAMLYGIHIISALIVGLFFARTPLSALSQRIHNRNRTSFPSIFCASVQQAASTALTVTAFLTMFSILLRLLSPVFALLPYGNVLDGMIELTNGLDELTVLTLPRRTRPVRGLFAAKLLHGTLAAVLTAFLFSLSPAVLTVSSPELTPISVRFRYTLAVLFVSALYPIWGWKKRRK